MTATLATGTVFPLGYHLGRDTADRHRIGVAGREVSLSAGQAAAWFAAHGAPAVTDDGVRSWTTADVARTARVDRREIDALAERRAVAVVGPGDLERFAAAVVVRPLLIGFGNSRQAPDRFGIGTPGRPPVVEVDALTYQLWQWGPLAESVWDLCSVLAELEVTDPALAGRPGRTPGDVLTEVLDGLRAMIARNAAHLDLVT